MKTQFTLLRITTIMALGLAVIAPVAAWTRGSSGPTRTLLEETHEACSKDSLKFTAKGGTSVTVPYGESKTFRVSSGEITWFCGGSKERTGCPAGTNVVEVVRGQGRPFTVRCFRDSGDAPEVLEHLEEACGENVLTVVGKNGGVKIDYNDPAKEFSVSNGEITWYCGATRERSGCPDGTNWLKVKRSGGRGFTIDCMKR